MNEKEKPVAVIGRLRRNKVMGEKVTMEKDESFEAEEQRLKTLFGIHEDGTLPAVSDDTLLIYLDFLKKHLVFPMKGSFTEETGPLQSKMHDVVIISLFSDVEEFYGVIICGVSRGINVEIPLLEFDLDNEGNSNYQFLEDYKIWFWNYR